MRKNPKTSKQPFHFKHLLILILSIGLGLSLYVVLAHLSSTLTFKDYQPNLFEQFQWVTFKVWLPWLLLTPIMIGVGLKFPIKPSDWLVSIVIHSGLLLLLSLIHGGMISVSYHYSSETMSQAQDFEVWQHIGHYLFGDGIFLFDTIIYTFSIASLNLHNFSATLYQEQLLASDLNHRLKAAQLQTLKSQLNPHFLFNTLNVISVLVLKKETKQATEMIEQLSSFLRHTLEHNNQHLLPLREEINQVNQYLAIEKIRFGDRLHIEIYCEDDALTIFVPSMLLQPLVENAMQHGIEHNENTGKLTIECRCINDALTILIRDNGVGCRLINGSPNNEGIGISNTKSRLLQMYGKDHRFTIESELNVGTTITLSLPTVPSQRETL